MPNRKRDPSIPSDAIEREGRNSYLADFNLDNVPAQYSKEEKARWVAGFKRAKQEAEK